MSQEEAEIESPTGYDQCPVCGEIIKSKGKYGHFSRRHSELNYEEYKDKFKPAKPPEAPAPPEGGAPYKVEPDVNAILRDILETSQKNKLISQSVVDEIMDWANRMGSMDPNYLTYLLTGMRGVSVQTANIISSKYAMTLQKAQQEGRVQLPFPIYPPAMPTAPGMFPMFPYQPTAQQPFYQPTTTVPGMPAPTGYPPAPHVTATGYPPAPYVTAEQLEKIMREREEKSRLDKLEERLSKLDRDFAGALTTLKEDIFSKLEESRQPSVQYVEEQIPVDEEGGPCDPKRAVSVKRRLIPITERGLTAEDVRKIVEESKEKLTLEDVRRVVKEEVPKEPPEKITKEDITKAAEEAAKRATEAEREKAETERRHRELLDAVERARVPATGVTTTEGVLATVVQEAARVAEKKQPVKIIVEAVAPSGVTSAKPPSERAGEAERGGVLEGLAKEGLVVRVVERLRR